MFSPASVAKELEVVATELEGVLPALGVAVPAQVVIDLTAGIDAFKQSTAAFAAADVQATPDMVHRISNDANAVFAVMAGLPLPGPVAGVFRVAQFVVPVLVSLAMMFI